MVLQEYATPLAIVASALLLALGRWLHVPSSVLLLCGGLAIGLAPGIPQLELNPEILLFGLLPPAVFFSTAALPLRLVRATFFTEVLPGVMLLVAPTVIVGVVAHLVLDLPWSSAVLLGVLTAVGSNDVLVETAARLQIPRTITDRLRGQRLVTSPVMLPIALIAIETGRSQAEPLTTTVKVLGQSVLLGAVIGVIVGFAFAWLRRKVDDPPTHIALAICTPFAVTLAAGALDASPLIGALAAGFCSYHVYSGKNPTAYVASTRLWNRQFWQAATYLLNGILCLLVGWSLPDALEDVDSWSPWFLFAATIGLLILVTFARFLAALVTQGSVKTESDESSRKHSRAAAAFVVAWSGTLSPIALVIALLIPQTTDDGAPFPDRNLLFVLTGLFLIASHTIQGLTFPRVIKTLGFTGDKQRQQEEQLARETTARAANKLHQSEAFKAERRALIQLHEDDQIGDGVYQKLLDEIDLKAAAGCR